MRFRALAVLVVISTLLLTVGAAALIAYQSLAPSIEAQAFDRVAGIGASKASQLELETENLQSLLSLTGSRTQMRVSLSAANDGADESAKMTAILTDAVASIEHFVGASLYLRDGTLAAEAGRPVENASVHFDFQSQDRDLFSFIEGQGQLWNQMFDPLYLDEEWIGSLVVVVDARAFSDLLGPEEESLGTVRHLLILPEEPESFTVGVQRWGYVSSLKQQVNAGPQLDRVLNGFRGQTDDARDLEGHAVFTDARDVQVGNGTLMTNYDRATALAPLTNLQTAGFVAFGLALVTGLAAGTVLSGFLSKPVQLLREAAVETRPGKPFRMPSWPGGTPEEWQEFGAKFREMSDRMESALASRTLLLNMVSHELNTPVTPAMIELTMLQEELHGPLSKGQRDSLASIERQLRKVSSMTEQMLSLSRIEDRGDSCSVADPLSGAIAAYENVAKERGLILDGQMQDALISGEAKHWEQVFDNLLSNAIKYSETGTISVHSTREKEGVRISIRDQGIGLPPGGELGIFDPFVRLHDAHDAAAPGTGMGLYVVRRIVETFGGSIEAIRHEVGTEICIRAQYAGNEPQPVADA